MTGDVTVQTIDLGDGTTVRAEVIGEVGFETAGDGDGYGDVALRDRVAQLGSAVALSLDQVRGTVQGIGRWAAETIAQGDSGAPDSFEVEFGLKLAVKSGQLLGIIAEAGSEAGLTVKLSWDLAARRERANGTAGGVAGGTDGGTAGGGGAEGGPVSTSATAE
ncbi:CU044_2847 family protein [Kitasatospora sp. NPDC017646]|uniref:CU044_2847 family protein n=1 Tax=Kitasatospora sp. NPDC017646 TaxID=3364024 RepID=UPI0037B3C416